jgi:hypothetical protein
MKIMNLYEVRDKETGTMIDMTSTEGLARKLVECYEDMDKEAGNYTEGFYEIILWNREMTEYVIVC